MANEVLQLATGELTLRRTPESETLRAWDRADQLLIDLVTGVQGDFAAERGNGLLIVGDRFGALTCALTHLDPRVCIESAAGRDALRKNLATNGNEMVRLGSILELDESHQSCDYELVAMRAPKSISELRDTLSRIRPGLANTARVVVAGMDKHLPGAIDEVLDDMIGPTVRHRATGRARHFVADVDPSLNIGDNSWPQTWRAHGVTLVNHGGGFSPGHLDIGTDFLLGAVSDFSSFVDPGTSDLSIVDLGCGNGIVGLRIASDFAGTGRQIEVIATDDSALAIDATHRSWEMTEVGSHATLKTHHCHRLAQVVPKQSVELIVVNPPFHVDRVIGDEVAWSMFVDARRSLKPGGALIVVGNRHLAYHAKLSKIFGNVESLASNKRFVVHVSRRDS